MSDRINPLIPVLAGTAAGLALAVFVVTLGVALSGCGVLGGIKQSIPPPTTGAYAVILDCDGVSARELLTATVPVETTAVCDRLNLRLEALERSSRDPQRLDLSCDGDLTAVSLSPGADLDLGVVECSELNIRLEV